MKRHEALSVGEIINRAIIATGNAGEYDRQQACFVWAQIVGPTFNSYTTRRWIAGDVLHVTMSSAVMKSELLYRKQALVDAINTALGKPVISGIEIH